MGVDQNDKAGKPKMNCGHTIRKCTELCILAKRGKGVLRKSASVPDIIFARPREPHRKPDEQYGMIEALHDGPYLELFARYPWPGLGYRAEQSDRDRRYAATMEVQQLSAHRDRQTTGRVEAKMSGGRGQRTQTLIDTASGILSEIQPAIVRAVCYKLFVAGLTDSMKKPETDRVSRALVIDVELDCRRNP